MDWIWLIFLSNLIAFLSSWLSLQVDGVEIKKSSTCTTWSLSSSILKGIHQIPGDGDDGDGVGGDDGDDDYDLWVRRISH